MVHQCVCVSCDKIDPLPHVTWYIFRGEAAASVGEALRGDRGKGWWWWWWVGVFGISPLSSNHERPRWFCVFSKLNSTDLGGASDGGGEEAKQQGRGPDHILFHTETELVVETWPVDSARRRKKKSVGFGRLDCRYQGVSETFRRRPRD